MEKSLRKLPVVHFRQRIVGEFYAALVVREKVIVELKAAKAIAPDH